MGKRSAVAVALGVLVLVGAGVLLHEWRSPPTETKPRAASSGPASSPQPPPAVPLPRGALHVRGLVRDARGRTVPGIEVSATVALPGESLSEMDCDASDPGLPLTSSDCDSEQDVLPLVEAGRGAAPVLSRTVTAEDGTFTLEGLPAGQVALWALGAEGAALKRDVAAGTEGVELALSEGTKLSGRVVDETGAPIPAARVTVFHTEHSRYFESRVDANGRFSVGPLPDEGSYTLVASSPGTLPAWRQDVEPEELTEDLILYRPRRITGQVLAAGDRPAPGARVQELEGGREVVADAEGRFTLEPLRPGAYELLAEHAGQHGFARVTLEEEQSQAEATLRLGNTFFVEGTVRDDAGRPLADAQVLASSEDEAAPPVTDAASGKDGHFRIGPLVAGTYTFTVQAELHLDLEEERAVTRGGAPLDFTVARAVLVEGLVTDAEGHPLPDVDMNLRPPVRDYAALNTDDVLEDEEEEGALEDFSDSATTGPDGRFALRARKPGSYLLDADSNELRSESLTVRAPARDVRVVLRPGGTVTGTVLDARGEAMPGITVSLKSERAMFAERYTATDEQGRFTLKGAAPGTHTLEAELNAGGVQHRASRTVVVKGTETLEAELRLGGGKTLSGVVVNEAGRALADAVVSAELSEETEGVVPASKPARVRTGPDGRFTFEQLVDAEYVVRARLEGHAQEVSNGTGVRGQEGALARPGARELRLVLRYQGCITGRLVREDGAPITRFDVNGRSERDPEGAFRWCVEEPRKYVLLFEVPGLARTERAVEVPPGGADVDLGEVRVESGRELRGRVVDAVTGAPVAGANLEVRSVEPEVAHAEESPLSQANTDATGAFQLPPVEARPVVLKVSHEDYRPEERRLVPGGEVLELRLTPGAGLEGTVRDRKGHLVTVTIRLVAVETTTTVTLSGVDGVFVGRDLEPGEYVLQVLSYGSDGEPEYTFLPKRVRVPAVGRVKLALREQVGNARLEVRPEAFTGTDVLYLVPGTVPLPDTRQALRLLRDEAVDRDRRVPAYTWTSLPAGPYTLFAVRRPPGGAVELYREEVDVPAGAPRVLAPRPVWEPGPTAP